jgi:hypothetical protein
MKKRPASNPRLTPKPDLKPVTGKEQPAEAMAPSAPVPKR